MKRSIVSNRCVEAVNNTPHCAGVSYTLCNPQHADIEVKDCILSNSAASDGASICNFVVFSKDESIHKAEHNTKIKLVVSNKAMCFY